MGQKEGTMKLFYFASTVALWTVCQGYYEFQDKIPNGQHVPHPCKPNFVWHGVGHLTPLGGGETNQFGRDFIRLGHKWSVALCEEDSDGDGMTNGQELGDPNCVWTEGTVPSRTDNITHPGICDPWDSAQCQDRNTWVGCDVGDFKCDAIHDPGVRSLELRFPRTKVPTAETTYTCFVFDIPDDQPYHLIAFEPYIDNHYVMHHMVAMACDDTAELTSEPQSCLMGVKGCTETIAVWTLGMPGDCFHREVGFRFGKGAGRRLAIQHHWTNFHHIDHYYDSSGIKMYYTPNLRPNDAGVVTIGQMFLEIPPAVSSLVTSGACSSKCTEKYFKSPLKVVAGLNHMHYLGISGKMEVIRDGHVVYNLTNDEHYNYDDPHIYFYENPLVVLPGDELKMTCEFSSMNRRHTTKYGPGSHEEMCFGLITYFPKQSGGNCVQWKDTDFCELTDEETQRHLSRMFNTSDPQTAEVFQKIFDSCNVYGSCRSECSEAIAEVRKTEPLYGGQIWEYMKDSMWEGQFATNYTGMLRFISAIDTCDRRMDQSSTATSVIPTSGHQQGCQNSHVTTGNAEHGGQEGRKPNQQTNAAGTFLELAKSLGSKPLLQNIIFNVNEN